MIEFTLPIAPVAKGRPRLGMGRVFTPPKTLQFENAVKRALRGLSTVSKPLDGPLRVTVRFVVSRPVKTKRRFPTVRPDIDNFLKSIMDAGNGILWVDDACICEVAAAKLYDLTGAGPRIEVRIEALAEYQPKEK